MFKRSLILLLTIAVLFVLGCDKDNSTEPTEVNEFKLLTDIGDNYFGTYLTPGGNGVNVSIAAVFPILADTDASNDPFIIDWRAAADFAAGHIKGAVNISLGAMADKIEDGTIPADKAILNYCYSGQTASYATALLNLLGYEAQNLLFGMCGVDTSIASAKGWVNQIAQDEFVSQLTADVSTATEEFEFLTVSTGAENGEDVLLARMKEMLPSGWGKVAAADVFANPENYFIVNYWPEAEYLAPGHIAGAVNFVPKGAFKADERLKNLPTDKTIVVYCYTGQTSAQVTAYLQMLGYDAKSLLYGFNGFAYNELAGHKYSVPADDYSAIIVQ
jgi:rhodanese-related sulfurtransferase